MSEPLITIDEACKLFKVSRSTIDRWRKEGLPFIRVGRGVRFYESKIREWVEKNKQ